MATVVVNWTTQNENVNEASKPAHFAVTLGTVEAVEPLTSNNHSFLNVDPGTYQGAVQSVDAAGAAMNDPAGKPYAPALFTVVVPVVPTAPIVVNVTSTQTP
jgi:hypothetical protein